jgi:hypothetical protein
MEQNGSENNSMGRNMVEMRYGMKWWWKSWYGRNGKKVILVVFTNISTVVKKHPNPLFTL